MRISFDLDDTLICYGAGVRCEPRLPFYWRWLVHDEPLRHGTRALVQQLRARGCEIWVYTTSQRSRLAVACWLWGHGIRVSGVINDFVHRRYNRPSQTYYPPSKNPRRFGIELHVDDSDGVRIEGERHGFEVVVVAPSDADWAQRVLQAVDRLQYRGRASR
jgi:hypothetical protein